MKTYFIYMNKEMPMDKFDTITREITHINIVMNQLMQKWSDLKARQEAYLVDNPTLDPTYGIKLGKEDALETLRFMEDKFEGE